MPKKFKPYTKQQKQTYAKRFTKKELDSYRVGKRHGFLCGVHAPKRTRSYGTSAKKQKSEDLSYLFDSLDDIKF